MEDYMIVGTGVALALKAIVGVFILFLYVNAFIYLHEVPKELKRIRALLENNK